MPSYHSRVENLKYGNIQAHFSHGILEYVCSYVLQLSILASKYFFSKYGCFAMKALWQPHLVDIPNNFSPIQVFCYDCWLDYGNSNKFVFPFFLVDALFNLFCFHFFYVFWSSFCMCFRTIGSIFGSKFMAKLVVKWHWLWNLDWVGECRN